MTSPSMTVRLAKYLALTGLCSRRAATRYIRDGQIMIDGRLANHIDIVTLIESPGGTNCQESLLFHGIKVAGIEPKQYWMLNKSVGTDCRLLPDDPDSLLHLLPASPRLYPVGRLDKDSRGLLLLTNDGDLTQRLMHPDFGHTKTYRVRVDRPYEDDFLQLMSQGVSYKDVTTLPCKMSRLSEDQFEIVLTQGLNRQIRRMSQTLGYEVIDLKRIKIQSLEMQRLTEGEMRELTADEIEKLKRVTNLNSG